MNNNLQTGFLFAQPSFASGMARILDLWGQFDEYNESVSVAEADTKAIAADWLMVGQDMYSSMAEFDGYLAADAVTGQEKLQGLQSN